MPPAPLPPPVTSAPQGAAGPDTSAPGNAPFYDVLGERYRVLPGSDGYVERGVASWYGRDFHGKRTSSGESYDMNGLTAAHKTLPLPTTARVTNLSNGRSIVVRINDRGPFRKNRLIDLSYGAARELDMIGPGTALVEVQALRDAGGASVPATASRSVAAHQPTMFVQVGAFAGLPNAEALKRRLEQRGFPNVVIRYDARSQPNLYRVRVGPIADADDYDSIVTRVTALDIRGPKLVLEPASPASETPADGAGPPGG
jgi:rare lipoprotein A